MKGPYTCLCDDDESIKTCIGGNIVLKVNIIYIYKCDRILENLPSTHKRISNFAAL